MNTQLRAVTLVLAAIAATFSAYAVAQHTPPASDKAHQHEAAAPCPEGAANCSGKKKESCMHGKCMHGAGMDEGGCPMAALAGNADVRVENTKDGALIRLSVKDPAKVEDVQRMAAMLAKHFESNTAAPAGHGAHSHGK